MHGLIPPCHIIHGVMNTHLDEVTYLMNGVESSSDCRADSQKPDDDRVVIRLLIDSDEFSESYFLERRVNDSVKLNEVRSLYRHPTLFAFSLVNQCRKRLFEDERDAINEIDFCSEQDAHWRDRKSTRLNSSHSTLSRMPSSA